MAIVDSVRRVLAVVIGEQIYLVLEVLLLYPENINGLRHTGMSRIGMRLG